MKVFSEQGKVDMKVWNGTMEVDHQAMAQIRNVASLPIVWPHVAVMPDYHVGIGCTIGTVTPTVKAIIPSTVGVDLNCGMMALQTDINANDLKLEKLFKEIEEAIPVGGPGVKGSWTEEARHGAPKDVEAHWERIDADYRALIARHPKIQGTTYTQLGTLGTGNHFIEVTIEKGGTRVWLVLHSGSRGLGNRIGTYFISKAREEWMKDPERITLPDKDLAWLKEGTPIFDDYVAGIKVATKFAELNRVNMMYRLLGVLETHLDKKVDTGGHVVNCHHNYVSKERHYGQDVWVTRKGAVSAKLGEYGIIPGSMGKEALTYIVTGRGNPESFTTCSHGAGRNMSRSRAKVEITLDEHVLATEGVVCRKDLDVIDESPRAYKNIEDVMAAQADLVKVEYALEKILNIKG